MRKVWVVMATIGLVILLVGCGNTQKRSDQRNFRTNETSAYVERHFNRGRIMKYVSATTYNKPTNTVEFHLTSAMSKEMRGRPANQYSGTPVSFADRNDFHQLVKRGLGNLRRRARNSSVRAKLIYLRK